MMRWLGVAWLALSCAVPAWCDDVKPLRITKDRHEFVVQTPEGPLTIRRARVSAGINKGYVQPLVPIPGVTLVSEVDVLEALNDPATMVIDMRDDEDVPIKTTIPNSFHIPFNEIEDRLPVLGCKSLPDKAWDCSQAVKIVAFCYGPMCVQSPAGIARIVHLGYPVSKIFYYRGGMLDWEGIGLTTVARHRPLPAEQTLLGPK